MCSCADRPSPRKAAAAHRSLGCSLLSSQHGAIGHCVSALEAAWLCGCLVEPHTWPIWDLVVGWPGDPGVVLVCAAGRNLLSDCLSWFARLVETFQVSDIRLDEGGKFEGCTCR